MKNLTTRRIGGLVLVTLTFLACNDSSSPTAPVEAEPDPVPMTTDSFAGTIAQTETDCHNFEVVEVATAEVTVTSLEPLATLTVGISLGFADEAATNGCNVFAQDNSVRVGEVLRSTLTSTGSFCACISDVGNIFDGEIVTYGMDVLHP